MKFFACLFVLAAIATIASADQMTDKKTGLVGSSYGAAPAQSYGAPAQSYAAPAASYAAPPCAKNYLFSCQPNLAPVPCSSSSGGYGSAGAAGGSSGGYGSAGAYSQYVPQYAYPQYAYPQYAPQY